MKVGLWSPCPISHILPLKSACHFLSQFNILRNPLHTPPPVSWLLFKEWTFNVWTRRRRSKRDEFCHSKFGFGFERGTYCRCWSRCLSLTHAFQPLKNLQLLLDYNEKDTNWFPNVKSVSTVCAAVGHWRVKAFLERYTFELKKMNEILSNPWQMDPKRGSGLGKLCLRLRLTDWASAGTV